VQFVQQEAAQGLVGNQLVTVITERLRTFDIVPQIVAAPARTIVVDETFIPPAVVARVAEVKGHPHGGPPGQTKKVLGVQTGAEVVHGRKPGRSPREIRVERTRPQREGVRVVPRPRPMTSAAPSVAAPPGKAKKADRPATAAPPGQAKKGGAAPAPGGPPKGKGKGKGKG